MNKPDLIDGLPKFIRTSVDVWNMCDRKKIYLNKKTANKRAREFNQHVYECPKCGGYHLTKRPQQ